MVADRLALALEAEGHRVFFDRNDLAPGEAFHQRLREALNKADAMIFLVTPGSVAEGSYTLAELDIARQRWRRPAGHVLPVMLAPTPINTLPPYLGAVTVLQPRGELVAETVAAVARMPTGGKMRRLLIGVAVVVMVLAIASTFVAAKHQRTIEAALRADGAIAAQALQLCEDGSHEVALAQLTELTRHDPAAPVATTAREDCAMHWMRDMRAFSSSSGKSRTFDEQVTVVTPVLLQALAGAHGQRAADLRAHVGWGEYLRSREGSSHSDPVPHWRRALADDPDNVYAQAMWGHQLMPGGIAESKLHFERALATGRERAWVRAMQFGGSFGGGEAAAAYAVAVADSMRRGGEAVTADQRERLWSYAFSPLVQADALDALFAALPATQALATFDWLFASGEVGRAQTPTGRFVRGALQAHAGQQEAARRVLTALLQEDARDHSFGGELREGVKRELAALGRSP
jgi:hypothetical protein